MDDDPGVGRALQRTLRGHHVTLTHSGREAMNYLNSPRAFDIVFCDLMMAEVSGMELYEHVRATTPGLEAHFVFMTGGAFTPQAKDFVVSVKNPVLEKPFDVSAIQELIRSVAQGAPNPHAPHSDANQ